MSLFVHQESDASITFIVVSADYVLPSKMKMPAGAGIFSGGYGSASPRFACRP
jgi:hypothetical protein